MTTIELINTLEIEQSAERPWTAAQKKRAETLLEGTVGWVARNAPCLLQQGAAGRAEAREVISEAILRSITAGTGNTQSEGIGPDQVTYVDRSALPTLTEGDKARLRELCPAKRRKSQFGTIRVRPGY